MQANLALCLKKNKHTKAREKLFMRGCRSTTTKRCIEIIMKEKKGLKRYSSQLWQWWIIAWKIIFFKNHEDEIRQRITLDDDSTRRTHKSMRDHSQEESSA